MDHNHIGRFLKLNSLNSPYIEYQLFNFSKESLKQIFLNSKCGEIINGKEFKEKPPNSNLVGTKNVYPLICLYKKSKPKIKYESNIYHWKEEKTKKKIHILSNALMTLNILNLCEYYREIIKDEKKQKDLVRFYLIAARCQLNYYLTHFRNDLGLFINKNVQSSNKATKKEENEIEFVKSSENFDFSAQAYMMTAFLKCSRLLKDTSPYKLPFENFSNEILNMFITYKDKLFELSPRKTIEIIYGFNSYLELNPKNLKEFINIFSELIENFICKKSLSSISTYSKILFYYTLKNLTQFLKETKDEQYLEIIDLMKECIWDLNELFEDPYFKKTEINDSKDLLSFQIYLILNQDKEHSLDFFNNTLLNSKVFSSFPNIPKKGDGEKYFMFSNKDSNIIPDEYFKPNNYKVMSEANLTPIILKEINFNQDKEKFTKGKEKFDSFLNMSLIFFITNSLKNKIIQNTHNK